MIKFILYTVFVRIKYEIRGFCGGFLRRFLRGVSAEVSAEGFCGGFLRRFLRTSRPPSAGFWRCRVSAGFLRGFCGASSGTASQGHFLLWPSASPLQKPLQKPLAETPCRNLRQGVSAGFLRKYGLSI